MQPTEGKGKRREGPLLDQPAKSGGGLESFRVIRARARSNETQRDTYQKDASRRSRSSLSLPFKHFCRLLRSLFFLFVIIMARFLFL